MDYIMKISQESEKAMNYFIKEPKNAKRECNQVRFHTCIYGIPGAHPEPFDNLRDLAFVKSSRDGELMPAFLPRSIFQMGSPR